MRNLFGIFIILHGLVYLLYMGHSLRYFELEPGLGWPDGSWVFSKLLGDEAARWLAGAFCAIAAIGFAAAGIGLLREQAWWDAVVVGVSVYSGVVFILLWNGRMQKLDAQGAIGILINIALLAVVLIWQWPEIEV